jgi:hypothetical protein
MPSRLMSGRTLPPLRTGPRKCNARTVRHATVAPTVVRTHYALPARDKTGWRLRKDSDACRTSRCGGCWINELKHAEVWPAMELEVARVFVVRQFLLRQYVEAANEPRVKLTRRKPLTGAHRLLYCSHERASSRLRPITELAPVCSVIPTE